MRNALGAPPGDGDGGSGGGCFGADKSLKSLSDLKDFFGDLFLLGLVSLVFVAWRGVGRKP